MKFCDIIYKRPDIVNLLKRMDEVQNEVALAINAKALKACIVKFSDIENEWDEMATLCKIRNSIDMSNEFYLNEEAFFALNKPIVAQKTAELFNIVLSHPYFYELKKILPKIYFENKLLKSKCTSPEILELLSEENGLCMEYRKLLAISADYFSLNKLKKYGADRQTRKLSWEKESAYYLHNKDKYENCFDKFINVRKQIADKLGYKSFTQVGYMRNLRTCYDQKETEYFRSQIKEHIVPLITELMYRQAKMMELDKFRYYDFNASFKTISKPEGDIKDTYNNIIGMFKKISASSSDYITVMDEGSYINVFPSPNRIGGAFCRYLVREKMPFVFATMKDTGDIETVNHELGHGYCCYLTRNKKDASFSETSSDIGETPAMAMEFFAWRFYEDFYGIDAAKVKYSQLLSAISNLPYFCMVDEFQHYIYDDPSMKNWQRNEVWKNLENKYRPFMNYEDNEFYQNGLGWIKQEHIFTHPFYYIDYALAQIVTLQFFSTMQQNWEDAWSKYEKFCMLCGSENFTDILKKSGMENPFNEGVIKKIAEQVRITFSQLAAGL